MSTIPKEEVRLDEDGIITMNAETLEGLIGSYEEIEKRGEAIFGRKKDYCCRNNVTGE